MVKTSLLTGLLLLMLPAPAPGAPDRQPELFQQLAGVEHRVVRYEENEFSGWPANHGAWNWDHGREILVGFSCGPYVAAKEGHKIGDPERDLLARSLDGGETWTMVEPSGYVQDGPEPRPLDGPVDFQAPGFVLRVKMGGGDQPPRFYYSYDKGENWRGPFLFNGLDMMPELAGQATLTPRTDYLVLGPQECLILLSAAKGSWTDRSFAVATTDGGLTFSFLAWLTDEEDPYRAVMPQTVRLGPGEYLSLVRRRALPPQDIECWIEARHSADGGRTWSHRARVASTGFHNSNGSPPALIRLRDGRLLAAYANRSLGMILCRMSSDEGKTWGREMIVRKNFQAGPGQHGFADFGYPRLVERPDGRVAVIYYFSSKKRQRQHIACSIFSPDETSGEVEIKREVKAAPLNRAAPGAGFLRGGAKVGERRKGSPWSASEDKISAIAAAPASS
jgi:hypothetical protein